MMKTRLLMTFLAGKKIFASFFARGGLYRGPGVAGRVSNQVLFSGKILMLQKHTGLTPA
jgi:hypothetical protein